MHMIKGVTGTLSRFFPDSSKPPPPPPSSSSSSSAQFNDDSRQPQAKGHPKEGKSLTSIFSSIIPPVSLDVFKSNNNGMDTKSYQHVALEDDNGNPEWKNLTINGHEEQSPNSKSKDSPSSLEAFKECASVFESRKSTSGNGEDDDSGSRRSGCDSDVFEEASCPDKPLNNLLDDSFFITPELYEFLHSSLPNIVKGCQWILLYSTLKHGISLRTLIRKSADVPGHCLLIVGDMQGTVFGGLLDSPLKPTPKRKYQGSHQTFVFTTLYGEPRLFRPTGANRYYYICLSDLLAIGGGGNFALCLDGDLLNGTSGPCETFGNSCLAHSPEFELKNVELWGFTHSSHYLN